MIETFKGPLGSHKNYITYIALENQLDYMNTRKKHEEEGRSANPDKDKEFRLFLNAVESFNNVIDYLYFEHENIIKQKSVDEFRKAIHKKYPELDALSELANAYKHCVRAKSGKKNDRLLSARDLQEPNLNIHIKLCENQPLVNAEYEFLWPLEKHESKLYKVFNFWLEYNRNPNTQQLINT